MATPLAPAPTTPDTRVHGMCLHHADYHPMRAACWTAAADYYLEHPDIPEAEARARYQHAVEQAMLDQHIRQHLGTDPAGEPA